MTFTDEMQSAVTAAAGSVWPRYRRFTDRDDVIQQLWLWVAGHEEAVQKLLAGEEWMMLRRLRTVAERYCRAERAARIGYEPADEYFYSRRQLARLIFDAFDAEAIPPTEGYRADELYTEWTTEIADVRAALKRIPLGAYSTLRAVAAGEVPEDSVYVRDALWELQKALGGPRRT